MRTMRRIVKQIKTLFNKRQNSKTFRKKRGNIPDRFMELHINKDFSTFIGLHLVVIFSAINDPLFFCVSSSHQAAQS